MTVRGMNILSSFFTWVATFINIQGRDHKFQAEIQATVGLEPQEASNSEAQDYLVFQDTRYNCDHKKQLWPQIQATVGTLGWKQVWNEIVGESQESIPLQIAEN